jgi:hypothetical protein
MGDNYWLVVAERRSDDFSEKRRKLPNVFLGFLFRRRFESGACVPLAAFTHHRSLITIPAITADSGAGAASGVALVLLSA